MKFDITLKALLQKAPRPLLQILVNSQPQEVLTKALPKDNCLLSNSTQP